MARRIRLLLPVNEAVGESTKPFFDWSISPLSPTNIRLVSSGVGATEEEAIATIAWDSVPSATGYNIFRGEDVINVGLITEYSLEGLLPNVVEHLAVSAFNADGESEPSYFDILIEVGDYGSSEEVFPSPSNLSVVAGVGRTAILSWDALTSPLPLKYPVFKEISGGFGLARVGEATGESYTFENLSSNTTYKFGVSALYAIGESLPSTISYTTGELGEPSITNFRLESLDPLTGRVVLAWDALTGAEGYELSAPEFENYFNSVSGESVVVTLPQGIAPTFYLVAALAGGSRSAQASLEVKMPPGNVEAFVASNVTRTSFTLSWNEQAGEDVRYRLWDELSEFEEIITGAEKKFSGLAAGWVFDFRIVALKNELESPNAAMLEISDDVPIVFGNLTPVAQEIYENSILLSWNLIGADKYHVFLDDVFVADAGKIDFYHFTGLVSKTRHKFGVKAVVGGQESEIMSIFACTLPLIWYENVKQSSFDVVWQQYTPQAGMYYQAYVSFWQEGTFRKESGEYLRLSYSGVENLESYFVEIIPSEDSAGDKPIRATIGQVAADSISVIVPTPPYLLSPVVGQVEQTTLTMNFLLLPSDQFKQYEVFLGETKVADIGAMKPATYKFTGLTPDTSYELGVRYVKVNGVKSEKEVVSARTAA